MSAQNPEIESRTDEFALKIFEEMKREGLDPQAVMEKLRVMAEAKPAPAKIDQGPALEAKPKRHLETAEKPISGLEGEEEISETEVFELNLKLDAIIKPTEYSEISDEKRKAVEGEYECNLENVLKDITALYDRKRSGASLKFAPYYPKSIAIAKAIIEYDKTGKLPKLEIENTPSQTPSTEFKKPATPKEVVTSPVLPNETSPAREVDEKEYSVKKIQDILSKLYSFNEEAATFQLDFESKYGNEFTKNNLPTEDPIRELAFRADRLVTKLDRSEELTTEDKTTLAFAERVLELITEEKSLEAQKELAKKEQLRQKFVDDFKDYLETDQRKKVSQVIVKIKHQQRYEGFQIPPALEHNLKIADRYTDFLEANIQNFIKGNFADITIPEPRMREYLQALKDINSEYKYLIK